MERKLDHAVSSGEAGKTVGWILDSSLALSARQIRSLKFQPDGILLNGIRVRTDVVVREGDCLSVTFRETGGCLLVPAEGAVFVIYEDEDILAVNKPSGVVVHPSPGHYADSLLNRLEGQGFSHLHSIGRLDRDTSGLMVFAKHKAAALRLARQRENGRFRKVYLALVSGRPQQSEGTIDAPVGRMPGGGMRMQVCADGKPARTEYRVVREYKNYSLVAFLLWTGRTHQIRVHMAAIGHPLLGDPLYGTEGPGLGRAALHAAAAALFQPFTGAPLSWEIPLPEDLRELVPGEETLSALKEFARKN